MGEWTEDKPDPHPEIIMLHMSISGAVQKRDLPEVDRDYLLYALTTGLLLNQHEWEIPDLVRDWLILTIGRLEG